MWCARPPARPVFRRYCCTTTQRWSSTTCGYMRSLPVAFLSLRHIWALLRGRGRLGAVFVTGGHFLGNTMMARRLRTMPWRAGMQRIFSALAPIDELVADLNAFQPVVLGGYPSALEALAREQQAGRLHIHPVLINAAGETLTAAETSADRRGVRLSSGQLLRVVGGRRPDASNAPPSGCTSTVTGTSSNPSTNTIVPCRPGSCLTVCW